MIVTSNFYCSLVNALNSVLPDVIQQYSQTWVEENLLCTTPSPACYLLQCNLSGDSSCGARLQDLVTTMSCQVAATECPDITYAMWVRQDGGYVERVHAIQSAKEVIEVSKKL